MRAAVVEASTNIVLNLIIADASTDVAPDGCFLVNVDNQSCDIGWVFDAVLMDFSAPPEPEVLSDG